MHMFTYVTNSTNSMNPIDLRGAETATALRMRATYRHAARSAVDDGRLVLARLLVLGVEGDVRLAQAVLLALKALQMRPAQAQTRVTVTC